MNNIFNNPVGISYFQFFRALNIGKIIGKNVLELLWGYPNEEYWIKGVFRQSFVRQKYNLKLKQISAKRGPDSRFVIEANTKCLWPKLSQSRRVNLMDRGHIDTVVQYNLAKFCYIIFWIISRVHKGLVEAFTFNSSLAIVWVRHKISNLPSQSQQAPEFKG